jgi:hypothetical protein
MLEKRSRAKMTDHVSVLGDAAPDLPRLSQSRRPLPTMPTLEPLPHHAVAPVEKIDWREKLAETKAKVLARSRH